MGDSGLPVSATALRGVLCACGTRKATWFAPLREGRVRSCGCLKKERARARVTHGATRRPGPTAMYRLWLHIKRRCYNPRTAEFRYYGARYVQMAPEWRTDFVQFERDILATIGPKLSPKHSLDRLDPNGHYETGNLRWATAREQAQSRRPRPKRLHCPNGHRYSSNNVFLDNRGRRRCRTCMRQQLRRARRRQREAVLAMIRARRCAVCGGPIETLRRDRQTCSALCRSRRRRMRSAA